MNPHVITLDFETKAIGARPEEYPPIPVGCAVRVPGLKSFYLAWGHPTGNNVTPSAARAMLRDIWTSGAPLLFHNAKFDYEVGTVRLGLPPLHWSLIEDTMFLVFLQNPDRATLSLKPVAAEVLGTPPVERDAVREWLVAHGVVKKNDRKWGARIADAPGDVVGRYAIGDVDRTYALYPRYRQEIEDRGMSRAYDRERELMPVLLASEQRGLHTDLRALSRDVPVFDSAVAALDAWIRKRLRARDLNVDSGAELAIAIQRAKLADEANWARTETGLLSTSKEALDEALTDRALAGALLYRGTIATCLRTFMRPWLETATRTGGLIYTSWNQVRQDYHDAGANKGTRTGRLSSVPNFQNIPTNFSERRELVAGIRAMSRVADLRGILDKYALPLVRSYIVPARGAVLLDRDYNQQELRILAHYEDGELLEAYRRDPALDVHALVQTVISDIIREKIARKAVKILNFGMIYGMGIGKLAEDMGVDTERARTIKRAHARGFPSIPALDRELKDRAARNEPIRTWGGREYFCEPPRIIKGQERDFAYKLLNRLVQGSAADNTKQAMINYANRTETGALLMNVHDELVAECPAADRVREMRHLRDAMADVEFDVPMLSEGAWSRTRWTEMTKLPKGE
jgi:DNA polymerase-1